MSGILEKINVLDILREHVASLKVEGAKRTSVRDLLAFYLVPALVVAAFVWFGTELSPNTIGVLATALSIIAGLLFNLLVLLHSMNWTENREPFASMLRRFLDELHTNIAYAIVVALVAIVPLVIGSNFDPKTLGAKLFAYVSIYLSTHFGLTMLMVLKRMHTALQYRLNERS